MIRKSGTRRNLALRVLCLKSSIPAKAPNGARSASNRSLNSGILHFPLTLFILSTPKNISEIMFRITRKINRVGTSIKVNARLLLCQQIKLRLMAGQRALAQHWLQIDLLFTIFISSNSFSLSTSSNVEILICIIVIRFPQTDLSHLCSIQ